MTTKHTPGPWKVSAYKVGDYFKIESDPDTTEKVRLPNREFVAMTPHKENARLIAAAPELLAALERLTSYGNVFAYSKNESNPYEQAIAAIAKARGE